MSSRFSCSRWVIPATTVLAIYNFSSASLADSKPGFTVMKVPVEAVRENALGKVKQAQESVEKKLEEEAEDSVEGLIERHEKIKQTYESINSTNPFSPDFAKKKIDPDAHPAIAKIQSLLSSPALGGFSKVLADPKVQKGIEQITTHPDRKTILYCEIALMILMLFYKGWRKSKCSSFFGRVWVSLYTTPIYFFLSLVAIPAFVIGDPFVQTVTSIWKSIG